MQPFLPRLRFKMVRSGLVGLAWLSVLLSGRDAAAQDASVCPDQLDADIQSILNQPSVRSSRWGIAVRTTPTSGEEGDWLYQKNTTQFFVPASNAKIFVTAAALNTLGEDYRIRTSIYQESTGKQNEIVLRVQGHGDPSLSDQQLQSLVTQLRDRNISQIDHLIIDDSYFPGDWVSPSWEAEDVQAGYGAPANSLILNQNAINITLYPQRVGQPLRLVWENPQESTGWQVQNNTRTVSRSEGEYIYVGRDTTRPILYLDGQLQEGSEPDLSAIAITDPTAYFRDHLRSALTQAGIQVNQIQLETKPNSQVGDEIAFINSAPLIDLITEANQNSTNLYAEALLRLLGVLDSPQTSSALSAGAQAIPRLLSPLGVDSRGVTLADGSGLSRQNLVTPAAIVATLDGMARSPNADAYRNSFAVAGVSGTLKSRFQNTDVVGQLWGKTGTLRDAVALSGYLHPDHYEAITFSILVNDPALSIASARQAMDDIVLLLNGLQNCQEII